MLNDRTGIQTKVGVDSKHPKATAIYLLIALQLGQDFRRESLVSALRGGGGGGGLAGARGSTWFHPGACLSLDTQTDRQIDNQPPGFPFLSPCGLSLQQGNQTSLHGCRGSKILKTEAHGLLRPKPGLSQNCFCRVPLVQVRRPAGFLEKGGETTAPDGQEQRVSAGMVPPAGGHLCR